MYYYCAKINNLSFSEKLICWYMNHKRSLPWRESNDPYIIWLSEVILQQTRVKQGLPYFEVFKDRFPDVRSLARASQDEVLKLWEGLGYYSRARNMHQAAQQVVNQHKGKFPVDYKNLIQLKGVGDYTASAIASIGNDEKVAVVDGNVFRVLSRIFGISEPINSTNGKKAFKAQAEQLLPDQNIGTYNQAIMEFGALQCLPKNPQCSTCPVNNTCFAYRNNRQQEFPVKLKKPKVKTVYMNYLVLLDSQAQTLIRKRKGNGIWEGLFEFPLITSENSIDQQHIKNHSFFKEITGNTDFQLYQYNQQAKKHLLTHRKLLAYFWIIEIDQIPKEIKKYYHITDKDEISQFAFPVLLSKFIDKFFFFT